ncbi:ER membrane protein complex subunit 10-like [Rhopilema esculentum]|uniref:ER membrane protein complex subunit 10-like n=1 Tax=Rhopilema esculentum TaxID=499914 RepID=UPI0031E31C37
MAARELLICAFLMFLNYCCVSSRKVDDDLDMVAHSSFSLPLQHSFELGPEAKFTPRGSILFKTLRSSHASLSKEISLTQEELDKLEELVRVDGVYRIRAPVKIGEAFDKPNVTYVSSFIKACHLMYSQLSEIITVSIDNSGNVIGISIKTEKRECPQSISETGTNMVGSKAFNSTVHIQLQLSGAVPETQVFIRKLEREEAERLTGKDKDNRSFLAKYWMYILPAVFILMLAGQQEPQEGQT